MKNNIFKQRKIVLITSATMIAVIILAITFIAISNMPREYSSGEKKKGDVTVYMTVIFPKDKSDFNLENVPVYVPKGTDLNEATVIWGKNANIKVDITDSLGTGVQYLQSINDVASEGWSYWACDLNGKNPFDIANAPAPKVNDGDSIRWYYRVL
ncbi:MAG: DUF4430 domain-containing protein [Anaerovoracaceae bacterium]